MHISRVLLTLDPRFLLHVSYDWFGFFGGRLEGAESGFMPGYVSQVSGGIIPLKGGCFFPWFEGYPRRRARKPGGCRAALFCSGCLGSQGFGLDPTALFGEK